MPTRSAALDFARLIYKCAAVAHIDPEADRVYHRRALEGLTDQAEDEAHNHGGHEVHVVNVVPGSRPVELGPCRKCGEAMVLVEGELPEYRELPCDERGVIDTAILMNAFRR